MDDDQQPGGLTEQAEKGTGDNPDVGGIGDGPPKGEESDARFGHDAGGKAHTKPGEPHPDLQKSERSARDVGGPTSADDSDPQPGTEPGGRGDIKTKGFEPHQ